MAKTGGTNWRVFASLETEGYKRPLREIGVETRQFSTKSKQDWKRVGDQLGGLTGRMGNMGRSMTSMFSGMSTGAAAASGAILGISAAVAAVTTAVSTSHRAWEQFADIDIARRRTGAAAMGLGGSAEERRGMAREIGERVSEEWGIEEGRLQVALRDILGLDPASWKEAEELLVLGIKEFYTSTTDISQTASTFQGLANVWDKTSTEIADELTAIVQKAGSRTVLGTAATAASYYMPAARQGGFESDLAGAVFAALTQLGARPEQAGTRAAAVFRELGDPTKGLGKIITEQAQGRDLADLDSMELATIMAAAYDALGATALSGSAETRLGLLPFEDVDRVLEYIEAIRNSAGAFDQVTGEVTESSKIGVERASQLWNDLWKAFGEQITPEFTKSMKEFTENMRAWFKSKEFKDLAERIGKVTSEIVKLGAVALPLLLNIVTDFLDTLSKNKTLLGIVGGVLETLGDGLETLMGVTPIGVGYDMLQLVQKINRGEDISWKDIPLAGTTAENLRDAALEHSFTAPDFGGQALSQKLDALGIPLNEYQASPIEDEIRMIRNSNQGIWNETRRGADAGEGTNDLLEGEKDRAFYYAPFSVADQHRIGA